MSTTEVHGNLVIFVDGPTTTKVLLETPTPRIMVYHASPGETPEPTSIFLDVLLEQVEQAKRLVHTPEHLP